MHVLLFSAGLILLIISPSIAQTGYSLQVAAYTAPVSLQAFEPLGLPVQMVEGVTPGGERYFLYVVDDFPTYAEAEKARKQAVINGFPDTVPIKASNGRNIPLVRIQPVSNSPGGSTNPALFQNGYSLQIAAYSSPVPLRFFDGLNDQPLRQVSGHLPTGVPCYVYVLDGFETYAEAEKVRKTVVSHGFSDAITLKTPASRKPVIRVRAYTGPTGGESVPEIEETTANQPKMPFAPGKM